MNGFEVSSGIWFETEFNSIKKSKDQLRPIYEAFTNSWESLAECADDDKFINVDLYQTSNPMGDNSFDKIIIEDNGIGLNDDNYDRLKTLRKNTKGKLNKGTGRVQYLHFFGKTKIESVYLKDEKSRKKILELSKSQVFLLNQAFIKVISDEPTSESRITKVVFSDPLKDKDGQFYGTLNLCDMKERLVMHYMVLLCQQRNALPKITLRLFVDNQQKESLTVDQSDIPDLDHMENFEVNYATVENKEIVKRANKESFCFRSFKIEQEKLPKNSLFLISKNEVIDKKINLPIPEKDNFDGFRYLFFISGDYLDNNDSDSRGSVQLYSEKDLKKAVGEGDL